MRVIVVRVKERSDLLPLLTGLLEPEDRVAMGSINEPDQSNGYYIFPIRDSQSGPDMVFTYERGSMEKEEYKNEIHDTKVVVGK